MANNILVTSIGSKVPFIRALENAAVRLRGTVELIGTDCDSKATGRFFVSTFVLTPKMQDTSKEYWYRMCQDHSISTIFPTRNDDVLFFAKHSEWFSRKGIIVICSQHNVANMCSDKLLFFHELKLNWPVIPTSNKIDAISGASFVVKERFGAGSNGLHLNVNNKEATRLASQLRQPIFQPFIAGKELSIDAFKSMDGKYVDCNLRLRSQVLDGESEVTESYDHDELKKMIFDVLRAFEFFGPVVFQVIVDEKNAIHIIECNPRFGGCSTFSVHAGMDLLYWSLMNANKTPVAYEWGFERKNRLQMVRAKSDYFFET